MIPKLKDMLKRHEGYRNYIYPCPSGHQTIGYGHNIDANPLPKDIAGYLDANGTIRPEMAERLLDMDIAAAIRSCRKLYPEFDEFSDTRKMALIDFLFNVGEGTAREFKVTNKRINRGDWKGAAVGLENSKWYKQVGNRSREIVKMIRAVLLFFVLSGCLRPEHFR